VEISYKSHKLEKHLTNPKEMVKSFGQLARKVNQRLKDLTDADNFAIMRPQTDDGGLNWEEVTKIQMNEIEDYH
jgi:proteic killer suppression protein